MFKINFTDFINELEKYNRLPIKIRLYYYEDMKKIVIYYKSPEYWEITTEISKSDIIEFYGDVKVFKNIFLYDACKIQSNTTEFKKDFEKSTDVNVVEESDDYQTFYKKVVDEWKDKTVDAIDKLEIHKVYTPNIEKTFGEFLQQMMNSINSLPFLKHIRRYVKQGLSAGIDAAEKELDVNVAWTERFDEKVNSLAKQELDGYTINGEKWHGIKGATKELQMKILRTVQEDVTNKETREVMVKHIKELFDGAATSQAERIARTETTRFINEGKLTSYKESGIKGFKAYSAVMDDKTSDLCRRLHNKYNAKGIAFDDEFYDEKTGQSFQYPPSHVNCRCVVEYRLPSK